MLNRRIQNRFTRKDQDIRLKHFLRKYREEMGDIKEEFRKAGQLGKIPRVGPDVIFA